MIYWQDFPLPLREIDRREAKKLNRETSLPHRGRVWEGVDLHVSANYHASPFSDSASNRNELRPPPGPTLAFCRDVALVARAAKWPVALCWHHHTRLWPADAIGIVRKILRKTIFAAPATRTFVVGVHISSWRRWV